MMEHKKTLLEEREGAIKNGRYVVDGSWSSHLSGHDGNAVTRTTGKPSDNAEHANRWAVLILSACGTFMTTLDSSIVNISLPSIAHSFAVPLSGAIEWIVIGYLVIIAAVLLTCGRLADMLGRKPIWIAGLILFTLGSALCGMSTSLPMLIGMRLVQGIGAALIFSVNIAMITSVFLSRERGKALGTNAVVVTLGVSAGPAIGGIITQYLSWRWIFYVNVPIGIIILLLSWHVLTEHMHWRNQRFDPLGALLLAFGLAAITLGISFGQEWGWISPALIGSIIIGIIALVGAVLVEQRVESPILDLALLRNRVFVLANFSFMLCMLALFAPGFLLPFYFEQLRGFSTVQAGLMLIPLPLALAVIAPISGSLADRVGSRVLSPIGMAIACLGLVFLSQINASTSIFDIAWRLALIGIGQGLFQSPNTRTIMGAAPMNEQGEASGLLATSRVIGQSTSVAVAGTVFAALGGTLAGSRLVASGMHLSAQQVSALQNTFVTSIHMALLVCAAFAAFGIFTSLVRGNERAKAA
jgi:EmrB/QacA subfamily drug resistance transporter